MQFDEGKSKRAPSSGVRREPSARTHRSSGTSLGELLPETAMHAGDSAAIVDLHRSWTYAQAADDAGRVGRALHDLGIGRGERVGVIAPKSGEGFVAMHGVVRAGAVAVPLDVLSPVVRLAAISDEMGLAAVVAHGRAANQAAEVSASACDRPALLLIDQLAELDPLDPVRVDSGERAYVITSSGSTGEPKGIVHSHAGALAYVEQSNKNYGLNSNDRVTDIAPHHFDISTHSLWAVPAAGAANVVIPEPFQRLPASHSQRLADERVTFWYGVPFLLQQLVFRGDLGNSDLSALRWVHFGGEVISAQVIAEFMMAAPNARFANIFGPAEVNQWSDHILESAPKADATIPIGEPLAHTEVRIIDPDAEAPDLSDTQTSGEAWIATPQQMLGYWRRPDLNDRVFVEHDGKRWYRSGDLVSVDADGVMSFRGRVDHQVKVRGYRVELEAIEHELESLAVAQNVVVAVLRSPNGEDVLVAGLLNPLPAFDEMAFRESAKARLAVHTIPARIVTFSGEKFTGSGKLDRRALRTHVLSLLEK